MALAVAVYWRFNSERKAFERESGVREMSLQEAMGTPTRPAPVAPVSRGTVKVDRVQKDKQIDTGRALVSYTNDSRTTFQSCVSIQCEAFDNQDTKIGTNTRSFNAREVGAIAPGFTGSLEIPVQLNGATLGSMRCWASASR